MTDIVLRGLVLFSPVLLGVILMISARRIRRQESQGRDRGALAQRYRDTV